MLAADSLKIGDQWPKISHIPNIEIDGRTVRRDDIQCKIKILVGLGHCKSHQFRAPSVIHSQEYIQGAICPITFCSFNPFSSLSSTRLMNLLGKQRRKEIESFTYFLPKLLSSSKICSHGSPDFGSSSPLSTSYGSDASEGLTLKHQELLRSQQAHKPGTGKKKLEASPDSIQCGLLQSSKYCNQEHLGGNLPFIDDTQCGRNLKA
ncbi:hypothetical protein CMV_019594 [Castanea mollissima]|uniref:Uncharacterized protein n=1 Tax=Castanea mollissima TaxID=60419 RepID=A0A8J4R2R8_9ROSI|nr:hypothetical protein CMV_019594 [Castanea mollissima]